MIQALAFGGAFNPPTRAHIELADFVRKTINVEKVVFLPSKSTYIKNSQKKDFAFSDQERLDMLQQLANENPWMVISDFELKEENQPRTYITLCYLQEKGYQCRLLCGSDKIKELQCGWRYIDEIMHEFHVVAMSRNDDNLEEWIEKDPYLHQYKDEIQVVHTPENYHEISSSKVRELLRNHASKEELCELIPESVYNYLKDKEVE